mmetsp:Transcript_61492/g.127024  ORF Transcript_61492/g.127024 Transcript_61492/m.127024 type:complete len:119 (+) Transcript_61492:845-1201(+)
MELSSEDSRVDGAAGSQDDALPSRVSPLPVSTLPPEAVASVLRCQGFMRKLMATRAKPYEAQFEGRKRCPLCSGCFRVGEGMVKCYVDPDPSCRWVHVLCPQAIVSANGGRPLHPSLA